MLQDPCEQTSETFGNLHQSLRLSFECCNRLELGLDHLLREFSPGLGCRCFVASLGKLCLFFLQCRPQVTKLLEQLRLHGAKGRDQLQAILVSVGQSAQLLYANNAACCCVLYLEECVSGCCTGMARRSSGDFSSGRFPDEPRSPRELPHRTSHLRRTRRNLGVRGGASRPPPRRFPDPGLRLSVEARVAARVTA